VNCTDQQAIHATADWLLNMVRRTPPPVCGTRYIDRAIRLFDELKPREETRTERRVSAELSYLSLHRLKEFNEKIIKLELIGEIGFSFPLHDWLKAIAKAEHITLWIDSIGGDTFKALALFKALSAPGKFVESWIMDTAASAALIPHCAAQKRRIKRGGRTMIHASVFTAIGTIKHVMDMADEAEKHDAAVRDILCQHCPPHLIEQWAADVKTWSDDEAPHYLSDAESVKFGLADEIFDVLHQAT
jgi:ATP-dependent protease ClpP protease subunit